MRSSPQSEDPVSHDEESLTAALGAGDSPLDVEALVAEIRVEAEDLRRKVGPPSLPPLDDRETALRAVADGHTAPGDPDGGANLPDGLVGIGHLREIADPSDAPIHSHRLRTGSLIVAVKTLLRRLLTPVLDRQAAFNRGVLQGLSAVEAEAARRARDTAGQVGELTRRLIALQSRLDGDSSPAGEIEDFDYAAFEEAFRGPREQVQASQRRYLALFPAPESGPVADLGCGRGEFLELLREAGIPAWGVEAEESYVRRAVAAGLDVRHGDLLWALDAVPDGTLGGIVSLQVVEHLPLSKLIRLLRVARGKLRPGGCLVVETVNVAALAAFTRGWTIDPTHRQPLHPLTLRYLVDRAGFARSEIRFSGEIEDESRLEVPGDGGPAARNVARLNELLYGPQDYAVVAWA